MSYRRSLQFLQSFQWRQLLGCGLLLCGHLAIATEPPTDSLEKLAADFALTRKEITDKEVQQRQVMSSLFEINRKMKHIVTDQSNLVQERLLLEDSTKTLASKIIDLDEKLKSKKTKLRERLTAIYKLGGQGLARFVFSSSSSSQLEKNLKILGLIAKRDLDLIKDYASSVRELESKKIKFTSRLAKLQRLENRIKDQERKLGYENASKSKILKQIKTSKEFSLSKLNGLRNQSAKLNVPDEMGVLDPLFRPSFFEKKGQLPYPIQGTVTRGFGVVHDEDYNVSWSHKGLFIHAVKGSTVQNVFAGTVAYVGSVPGFGNTIIVDHGDHYYTVYAHNSRVLVQEGDEIQQNQKIALSGMTLKNTHDEINEGLYFEIRHFSEPYDPHAWLKGTL